MNSLRYSRIRALTLLSSAMLAVLLLSDTSPVLAQGMLVPAFPGAEGFGAESVGGRGGQIIEVTTLEDTVPAPEGSFRAAINTSGPRIVVFRVGGTINLQSRLTIDNPYITIAGQTAPGDGIMVTGHSGIAIVTHDVIIRYLKVRLLGTGEPKKGQDPFSIRNGAYNVMIDHCSTSWSLDKVLVGKDEDLGDGDITNLTFQRCIFAEGLWPHSTAMLINGPRDYNANPPEEGYLKVQGISVHHNLFVHNSHRNPKIQAGPTEVVNNVVYNWKSRVGSSSAGARVDLINNYWKPGPMTNKKNAFWHESEGAKVAEAYPDPSIYISGNFVEEKFENPSADNWKLLKESSITGGGALPGRYRRYAPLPNPVFPIEIHSAQEAYNTVLADSGANARLNCSGNWISTVDSVDNRVVGDVMNGTGWDTIPPRSPQEAGGFPVITGGVPCKDSDHDGMPNKWEIAYGFDPNRSADANEDADGDGFTNIEEYLNASNPVPPISPSSNLVSILVEAEDVASPDVIKGMDVSASSRWYMSHATDSRTATIFPVNVPEDGTYFLLARIYKADLNSKPVYIGINGSLDKVVPNSLKAYSWTRVETFNGSGDFGFDLASGENKIRFEASNSTTRLDALLLTNDANALTRLSLGENSALMEGIASVQWPTVDLRSHPVQDLDGDGLGEDVNGNGRLDFNDVAIFFRQMNSSNVQGNSDLFDYNANTRVDMDDVVELFRMVSGIYGGIALV